MKALVLHPYGYEGHHDAPLERLEEAITLSKALGVKVSGHCLRLRKVKAGSFFGKGQGERVKVWLDGGVALVIVNASLSAIQHRFLERLWGVKVLDRNALILEIFGARAKSKEGQLQVRLAHLRYQRSRLVRSWTHLERQRGGTGFMGGPGERQIESDRRVIDGQITRLKKEIAKIAKRRRLQRRGRRHYPTAVLVGYTNAGKSTLFNRLTSGGVFVKDQFFATLDPTARLLHLPCGGKMILWDTVGFISHLPHALIAAFHATLEEVVEADVIIHVRNAASSSHEMEAQDVRDVLCQLGLDEEIQKARMIELFNKVDALCDKTLGEGCLKVSARLGTGCDHLRAALSARLAALPLGSRRAMSDELSHAPPFMA